MSITLGHVDLMVVQCARLWITLSGFERCPGSLSLIPVGGGGLYCDTGELLAQHDKMQGELSCD